MIGADEDPQPKAYLEGRGRTEPARGQGETAGW